MSLLKKIDHWDDALKLRIRNFALVLLRLGLQPKERIVVALPRGQEAAIVIYAILSIGATYVPLDIKNPDPRLNSIVIDAKPALVVGIGKREKWCPQNLNWLSLEEVAIGEAAASIQPENADFYHSHASDLAAILYTSGSSGVPKGVALSHGAMCCFADWAGTVFSVGKEDRIASLAPFYFDLSVFDLFTSVRFGASVDYMPETLVLSPMAMVKWLEDHKSTLWYTVPTVLIFLARKGNLSEKSLPHLKKILFAGEVFPVHHLLTLVNLLPHVEFYNLFGPTETNVCCYWPVDRKKMGNLVSIPIGFPACDCELRINDEGELLVKGPSLMSGYFSQGMIKHVVDEQGWYHTGDNVSLGEEGELYYHGRFDRQFKYQGFRVEPAEIENVCYAFPGVEECAVFGVANTDKARQSLVACIGGEQVHLPDLMSYLKNKLPSYMIPERVVQMHVLPRLGNGKLDLQTLKQQIN